MARRKASSPAEGSAEELQSLYLAKARAELAEADSRDPVGAAVDSSGTPDARVVLLKGVPGPEDVAAGRALSGRDGEAARKALEALGFEGDCWFAACTRRPDGERGEGALERLELTLEAVDPEAVLALDADAASDLAAAMGRRQLRFGEVVLWRGRRVVAVDGLEASLDDERRKARVWKQMRALAGE